MDKLVEEYKQYADIFKFAEAQTKLILELKTNLKAIQDEKEHLKTLLESVVPSPLEVTRIPISEQELICREQLKRLKEVSDNRELSYEECKKVSEYSKILKDISSGNKKDIPSTAKHLDDNKLLELLNNEQSQ